MLFYVRVITLSFLLSPSLAGSFAPHRFLQGLPNLDECGTCEEITEYVDGFCCGMDSIGDRCFENLFCSQFFCVGEFGDDNFDDNFDDGVRGLDEIDGKFGNEDYGDYYDDNYNDDDGVGPPLRLPVCNNFNCDECGAFTDQVVEECCPFVIDVDDDFRLDYENPDIGPCMNTRAKLFISCVFAGCMDEHEMPFDQEDNPCESDSCDFQKLDEDMCMATDSTCAAMDGYCKEGCIESDTHACLPGLCSGERRSLTLSTKSSKMGSKSSTKGATKGAAKKSTKKSKDGTIVTPPVIADCMCFAPKRCTA